MSTTSVTPASGGMPGRDHASSPIYVRLAASIADDVLCGRHPEQSLLPSTNELAARHGINPATAARALRLLVEEQVAQKRRGIGMCVAAGARERIKSCRRHAFLTQWLPAVATEADKLRIPLSEAQHLLAQAWPFASDAVAENAPESPECPSS